MYVHPTPFFTPPVPPIAETDQGPFRFFRAVRSNALQIWPRSAYERDAIVSSHFGRKRFLLNSPKAIHRVLVENPSNYRRTPATIRILRPITGNGLLLSEGEDWRHQRRTIAPALAPRVMPMLARHIVGAAQETMARLAAMAANEQAVDLLSAMQLLALEIAARSMFSLEMHQHGAALRRMIGEYALRLARPYFLDLVLPVAIPTLRDLARTRFRRRWTAFMDEIIAARSGASMGDAPRDLFDMLLAARDPETGAAFSRAQLRDQMATMIVAGHETTALTLFWSTYLLAHAPAEQSRVAEEVCAVDFDPASASEALEKLTCARAVVNEALRLYPPAFALARIAIKQDEADGIIIPPGALIMISPWVLHRHVRFWERPDIFMPSRFLHQEPQRFSFMPFGAGPRVCVGAQLALAEAALVLGMLVRRFEIAPAEERPVLPVAVITTQPDHPASFRLRPRHDGAA
jgi:cytochrome P450